MQGGRAGAVTRCDRLAYRIGLDRINLTMNEPVSFFACAQDAVALVRDLVLTAGACVGMYVGYKGLKTWQKKLVGEQDFELARKLLLSIYRYRDAILAARRWQYSATDVSKANQAASGEATDDASLSSVYHGRLGVAAEARRLLEAQLEEAEVLWGTDPTASIVPLSKLEAELIFAVELYLRREWCRRNNQHATLEEFEQLFEQYKGVLLTSTSFGSPTKHEVLFEQRLTGAVSAIEATFKSHLPQRRLPFFRRLVRWFWP